MNEEQLGDYLVKIQKECVRRKIHMEGICNDEYDHTIQFSHNIELQIMDGDGIDDDGSLDGVFIVSLHQVIDECQEDIWDSMVEVSSTDPDVIMNASLLELENILKNEEEL
jgi:hypothetical protein